MVLRTGGPRVNPGRTAGAGTVRCSVGQGRRCPVARPGSASPLKESEHLKI